MSIFLKGANAANEKSLMREICSLFTQPGNLILSTLLDNDINSSVNSPDPQIIISQSTFLSLKSFAASITV